MRPLRVQALKVNMKVINQMKGFKSQVQTYDFISLVGLGWWAYLFFTDSKKFTAKNNERTTYLMADQSQFKLEWKWKF